MRLLDEHMWASGDIHKEGNVLSVEHLSKLNHLEVPSHIVTNVQATWKVLLNVVCEPRHLC